MPLRKKNIFVEFKELSSYGHWGGGSALVAGPLRFFFAASHSNSAGRKMTLVSSDAFEPINRGFKLYFKFASENLNDLWSNIRGNIIHGLATY